MRIRSGLVVGVFLSVLLVCSVVLAGAGDVNGDGVVNVQDLLLVVQNIHAGSSFNAAADVNGDGVVNIFDLVDVARDFGKTYSTGKGFAVIPYFSDGFENATVGSHINGRGADGFRWGSYDGHCVVSTAMAHSGNKSLLIQYPVAAAGSDSFAEQYFELAPNASTAPKEVWIEWYVHFPSNYVFRYTESPNNNKLWAIWAETYSHSPFVDLEYQGTSSSVNPLVNYYTVYQGSSTNRGGSFFDRRQIWSVDSDVAGEWHQIRLHLRLGDGGATDNGVADMWFDGNRIGHLRGNDSPFYDTTNNYFRNGYIMGWANAGFSNTTSFYIDDFKVYASDPGWFAPPNITISSPAGTLSAGTTTTTLSVTTDKNATCRYSTTANTSYSSMANTFSTTGGTTHSATVSGLVGGQSYTYYVRCVDASGSADTSDYPIMFSVAATTGPSTFHEPAGMTTIFNMTGNTKDWDSTAYNGSSIIFYGKNWGNPAEGSTGPFTGRVSVVDDPAAPYGKAVQVLFPNGTGEGFSGLAVLSFGQPYRKMYLRATFEYNPDWQQHPSGTTKLFYYGIPGHLNAFYPQMHGSSWNMRWRDQYSGANALTADPDVPAYFPPGSYHTLEIYQVESHSGASDGSMTLWLDGKKIDVWKDLAIGSLVNLTQPVYNFTGGQLLDGAQLGTYWGGSGGFHKTQNDWMRWGDIFIAGSN